MRYGAPGPNERGCNVIHPRSRLFRELLMAVTACAFVCGAPARASQESSDGTVTSPIVINELHVNPDVKTELVEFIELYNNSRTDVDLSGWSFTDGVFFTFPAGSTCPASGYVIVTQDPDHMWAKLATSRITIPAPYLFGPYGGSLSNEGEKVVLCDAQGRVVDEVDYQVGFPWPTVGDPVPANLPGTGQSLQLIHPALDNDLAGNWRSGPITPGMRNSVYSTDVPPCIRQVSHSPKQPRTGQVTTVTAKITDPDGIALVRLQYQIVEPGNYFSVIDGAYQAGWVSIDMHDDGIDGDQVAGDDIYTAQVPASVQQHRRLIRYRIFALDGQSNFVVVPYDDDPQPNFAYFVYDGVPAWKGAVRPGAPGSNGQVVEYGPSVMQSLPVYHLISRKADVEACTWLQQYGWTSPDASDFKWYGTIVYDGEVYDHIRYRTRGGTWRYAMGKNMWKFNFNRAHSFQARDDYGRPYDTKWDKLNFSACIQQGDFQHRGEQGMFEAASFKLYGLMGCPSPNTNWVQFRIIDEAPESGSTQYVGDFWGLYMAIEAVDGRFLDERDLPDGNVYRMNSQSGNEINNQGPTAATDWSDLNRFVSGYSSRPTEAWWRTNVDLDAYYGFRCVTEGVHNGDIGYGKNYFYYLNPETNRWSILPWDLDLTWAENMYGNGQEPFISTGSIFSIAKLQIEYQNRLREFMDLLYNTDQVGQLLDDMANIIDYPAGGPSMVGADRAMWDYNPVMISGYVNSSKAGQGRYYQAAATRDFRGMVQLMKDYVVVAANNTRNWYGMSGPSLTALATDASIPATPSIVYTGPQGYAGNALTFQTSGFSDPQGAGTFAGMQWRLAEVEAGSTAAQPVTGDYILVPEKASWKYFKGTMEPSATVGAWRQAGFDDSTWLTGAAPIGYGETFITTVLSDMQGNYGTIYMRKAFDVTNRSALDQLRLELRYDDGVVVWLNGRLIFQDNAPTASPAYDALAPMPIEMSDVALYDLGSADVLLVEGTNVLAVQVLNVSLGGSSDCFGDVRLIAPKPETPTTPAPTVTPTILRQPGKYEIEPVWESGALTTFNASAKVPASVVHPGRTYRVRCRMKDDTGRWSHWSAPVQFVAGEPIAAGVLAELRLTELMYDPAPAPDGASGEDFEFIELKNRGDETLDLSGISITDGVTFSFQGSTITNLGPGQFVLVVRNRDAFLSRYGAALSGRIAGEYTGKLANDGERVAVVDFWNGTVAEVTYGDGSGWPLSADGAGHSLVPLDSALLTEPDGSLNCAANWRASTLLGGSPGQDDPQPTPSVLVNEFMANTVANDWIELYNPTGSAINLAGWFLSDDVDDLRKWALPAVSIPSHGFVTFDEATGFHADPTAGFALSRTGEDILLSYLPGAAQDRVVDAIHFKAQETGVSLGRYPDGGAYWFRLTPSQNVANGNPLPHVVINEIMYNSVDDNEEYIELFNPTGTAASLSEPNSGWRLAGGVDYTFPVGTVLPAGGRLVIVGFDPYVETAKRDALVAAYKVAVLTPGVNVFGPWQGDLANRGERVALEKPQPPGRQGDSLAWEVIDEVVFGDVTPWPQGPDGEGSALQRVHADAAYSGNDPANWRAASPSPGIAP
jgi:hypothetical protein